MVKQSPWVKPASREERRPALRELPEEELMVAYVVHDDSRAFRELHRRLRPGLIGYALRRLRSRELAEDLVQQAFLNAHLARERFQLGSSARPWLTRILVNLVRDHLRSARLRPLSELVPTELAAPEVAPPHERSEAVSITRKALSGLGPQQREVIELHWLEERPFPEIAAALGERVSTVKVRAHRAYKQLRRALDAEFPEQDKLCGARNGTDGW
ncbi:MAG TPA: RNA polymerase sigma factor [Polyangiaceae bacterium]|jgi:RNA polymerase sigma-70 factor (ECF subfamily)|nr:RNA polymerase sigma factor [Polyangiaceae bacterium]